MEFMTRPWFVINRGWEKLEANEKGIINTENKQAIEVLSKMFPVKNIINEIWKSKAKK